MSFFVSWMFCLQKQSLHTHGCDKQTRRPLLPVSWSRACWLSCAGKSRAPVAGSRGPSYFCVVMRSLDTESALSYDIWRTLLSPRIRERGFWFRRVSRKKEKKMYVLKDKRTSWATTVLKKVAPQPESWECRVSMTFPAILFLTRVSVDSWSANVYRFPPHFFLWVEKISTSNYPLLQKVCVDLDDLLTISFIFFVYW